MASLKPAGRISLNVGNGFTSLTWRSWSDRMPIRFTFMGGGHGTKHCRRAPCGLFLILLKCHVGQSSEELKNARAQNTTFERLIETCKAKQLPSVALLVVFFKRGILSI